MIARFLNIFNIRQMLSAFVLLLMTVTLVLTLFSVEKIAFAEPAEVAPGCGSLLSSGSSSDSDPLLSQQLISEEISKHVNELANMYLNLFHGPNASQKNNFLSEEMIMKAKLAEYEALIPDISTRLSRVVEERFPQFQEAMSAKEHERAERLRESEEQLRELQKKLDVCSRTPQVRDEIMHLLGGKSCDQITLEDLKKITKLDLSRAGSTDKISVLNDYDFYGLSSLKELNLYRNQLSALPEGVFAGLSSLESLNLHGNRLSILPEGVFAGLSALETLNLNYNQISVLPEEVFAGLSSLKELYLYCNQLSVLPEGVFAGLSSLETLYLSSNRLSILPEGVFAGLSELERLDLDGNQLSDLPEGVFAGLSSLETLYLHYNANFNFEIGLLKNLKKMAKLSLPSHLENSLVTAELRKLLPGTKIYSY